MGIWCTSLAFCNFMAFDNAACSLLFVFPVQHGDTSPLRIGDALGAGLCCKGEQQLFDFEVCNIPENKLFSFLVSRGKSSPSCISDTLISEADVLLNCPSA
mmetsp:Transcript_46094/g.91952  ORF Transcript_46094/g.91952 Transcript_46094/m.91952 type:complete len:101 (-) Transcript_46094:851-1153(-)